MAHERPFYERQGVRYPRLTRILSILNDPGKERVTPRAAAQAMRVGTAIHAHIAKSLLHGTPLPLPKGASAEVRGAWKAWCRWYEHQATSLGAVNVESPAIAPQLGYGCTPDLVRANEVIEWKVASAIRPLYWIQLHAQVPCIWPVPTDQIRVRVVRLDKYLSDFEDVSQPYDPAIAATFLHLKEVYMAWYAAELNAPQKEEG